MNYVATITAAKVAARDILRLKKIAPWMSKLSTLTKQKTEAEESYAKRIAEIEKRCAVKEFEANALAADHPAKADRVEEATKFRETTNKNLESEKKFHEENIKAFDEEIKECETAITEWTEGKRLVSKDDLAAVTNDLCQKQVTESFLEGEYNEATA